MAHNLTKATSCVICVWLNYVGKKLPSLAGECISSRSKSLPVEIFQKELNKKAKQNAGVSVYIHLFCPNYFRFITSLATTLANVGRLTGGIVHVESMVVCTLSCLVLCPCGYCWLN